MRPQSQVNLSESRISGRLISLSVRLGPESVAAESEVSYHVREFEVFCNGVRNDFGDWPLTRAWNGMDLCYFSQKHLGLEIKSVLY